MTTDTTTRRSASGIARPEIRPTGLLRQSLAITRRNLIHIKRMPEMLMDVTIQPVMFVLLFAYVFGGSISVQGSPAGYREWLDATAIPDRLPTPGLEAWGDAEGNRVEVSSAAGRVTGVRVLVDVRRLDAKFAAGLLTFVRAADAALVRADGLVVEPTAGGFGLPLRGSAAWRAVQSPAALIDPARVGRPADE